MWLDTGLTSLEKAKDEVGWKEAASFFCLAEVSLRAAKEVALMRASLRNIALSAIFRRYCVARRGDGTADGVDCGDAA